MKKLAYYSLALLTGGIPTFFYGLATYTLAGLPIDNYTFATIFLFLTGLWGILMMWLFMDTKETF